MNNMEIYNRDISSKCYDHIRNAAQVAWDIETSGLNWRNDHIAICQLYTKDELVTIVKCNNVIPDKLRALLSDPSVRKVFHHAMFDLRFMSFHWKVSPVNIACTKIAAKLISRDPDTKHSLKLLLKKYLGVSIDKHEQLSNWFAENLSADQISYAVRDVKYLFKLLAELEKQLKGQGDLELAYTCFEHIPTRVTLDVLGCGDVYSY